MSSKDSDVEQAEHATETSPLLVKQGTPRTSPVSKLILKIKDARTGIAHVVKDEYAAAKTTFQKSMGNKGFYENVQLAIRGATFVVIFGIPFAVSNSWLPLWVRQENFWYGSATIIMLIYTLYKSFGETMNFAFCGVIGTFIAALACWLMHGFFPLGVAIPATQGADITMDHLPPPSPNMFVFWIGMACAFFFVFFMLWLNFDVLTQIFALSNFVYHWMSFMNPDPASQTFSANFKVNPYGTAMSGLAQATTGAVLAVAATLLPYPILSIQRARDTSMALAVDLGNLWQESIVYYCGDCKHVYGFESFQHSLTCLKSQVDTLDTHLNNAWWECFGFGRWGRALVMLRAVMRSLKESYDRLLAVLDAYMSDVFDEEHRGFLQPLEESLKKCSQETSALFLMCAEAAGKGGVEDETSELEMRQAVERVRDANSEFYEAFQRIKREKQVKMAGTIEEHTFLFGQSAFSCFAIELAEGMLDEAEHIGVRNKWIEAAKNAKRALPPLLDRTVIFDGNHMNYVLRNALSIWISLAVGMFGIYPVVPPYTAGIACTVSILLSKFVGTAMVKNLDRVQGVVLGTLLGTIVHYLVATCTFWGLVFYSVVAWIWTSYSLFLYYHSQKYSTVGCLLAAFGMQTLLIPCEGHDEFNSGSAYLGICTVVISLIIMVAVDLLIASERASTKAHRACVDSLKMVRHGLKHLCDPAREEVYLSRDEIVSKISFMRTMGDEAYEEPRFWRCDWNKTAFDKVGDSVDNLRIALSNLEYIVAKDCISGQPKLQFFVRLCKRKKFQRIVERMNICYKHCEDLMDYFVWDEEAPFPKLEYVKQQQSDGIDEIEHALKIFADELDSGADGFDLKRETVKNEEEEEAADAEEAKEAEEAGEASQEPSGQISETSTQLRKYALARHGSAVLGEGGNFLRDEACLVAVVVSGLRLMARELRLIKHALLQNA
eukprot:gnl/TRDRNA2_/TRDRNA2_176614_c7_seq28.p1 gnl/TRDRNA2_/TRDRNA2_176614_c7~~gnl/TRDRNA2_/TRDRNA2_176614_c7_seq28.p1  ORF type:complete len:946 (+),score=171.07 gnl/TRDRNA2_/TRDRNA2_176614_c7_seq28:86-2923(+)